ncbi:MAG: hypothetical protein C4345_12510 [Chloroflexota bacterium]
MRHAVRIRAAALVLAIWLSAAAIPTIAAPGAPPANAGTRAISASQYSPDSEECAMLAKINAYRHAYGKAALKLSRTLGAAAEHHSRDMAASNTFSHTLSNGTTWSQNITNHGYPTGTYRAENIAAGYARAADTFSQWKNSSSHRANMLRSTYKAIGIGRAYSSTSTYRWYWTTTFGSTVDSTGAC